MEVGINLCSNQPYEEIAEIFLENDIRRTFVCVEHPQFDEAMKTLKKSNIKVENLHAPFKGQNTIWEDSEAGEEMLGRLCHGIDCCVKYDVNLRVTVAIRTTPQTV